VEQNKEQRTAVNSTTEERYEQLNYKLQGETLFSQVQSFAAVFCLLTLAMTII
jgi:hypothetical protein